MIGWNLESWVMMGIWIGIGDVLSDMINDDT